MSGVVAPIRYPFEDPPPVGAVVEVAPGVFWARMPMPGPLNHVNIYVLDDGDGWTVIDTGLGVGKVRAAWDALLAGPLAGKPVRRVIVTHYHPDHLGLAGWFQTAHGAELWTSRTAWLFGRMLRLDEQPTPPAELLAFWRAAGMDAEVYAERAASRPMNYCDSVAALPLGYVRIKEGDEVFAGGRRWRAHMGGGHAAEHVTLWSLEDDLALVGDQILADITPNLGVYATEPEADPVGDWFDACARLAQVAEDRQLILPGHKKPFVGAPGRLADMVAQTEAALERLRGALSEPKRATECFEAMYQRRITGGAYGLALVETVAHLNHLRARDEASREIDADGAWLWRRA